MILLVICKPRLPQYVLNVRRAQVFAGQVLFLSALTVSSNQRSREMTKNVREKPKSGRVWRKPGAK